MSKKTIIGVFSDVNDVQAVVRELKSIGIKRDRQTVFLKDEKLAEKLETIDTHVYSDKTNGRVKGMIPASSGGPAGAWGLLFSEVGLKLARRIRKKTGSEATDEALVSRGLPENETEDYIYFIKNNKLVLITKVSAHQESKLHQLVKSHKSELTSSF